jgi:hypothetical protein
VFWRRREPEISRDDLNAIMLRLMKIDETLERLARLQSDDDGEEEEEPES